MRDKKLPLRLVLVAVVVMVAYDELLLGISLPMGDAGTWPERHLAVAYPSQTHHRKTKPESQTDALSDAPHPRTPSSE